MTKRSLLSHTDALTDAQRSTTARQTLRLSREASRKFACTFRALIRECRLSVYALFLDLDYPGSTLRRWLTGTVCIPAESARNLVNVLIEHSSRLADSAGLRELQLLADSVQAEDPGTARLRAELRARRVPVRRTIEALQAANLLPSETSASVTTTFPTHSAPSKLSLGRKA